jgi:hypothetical protein
VKFRRKSAESAESDAVDPTAAVDSEPVTGPYDVDDLPADDGVQRLDVGSLLIEPVDGLELRLQVDQDAEEVQAVVLAGPEGAVELRAFAAPRGGDLWSDLRPRIAADFAQRGGTASEHTGRFGTELLCQLTVKTDDGRTGTQVSRIVGINGPRWMLRATLLGKPAQDLAGSEQWEDAIERVVVRRGSQAMAVGDALPLTLPPRDQLVERTDA